MEMNLQRRMGGLKDKVPDIQKTLDTVLFLKSRKVGDEPVTRDPGGGLSSVHRTRPRP